MPSSSEQKFIVTPFLPKELVQYLEIPIETFLANYSKPNPTTNNKKKKKKKRKAAVGGAHSAEPVKESPAVTAPTLSSPSAPPPPPTPGAVDSADNAQKPDLTPFDTRAVASLLRPKLKASLVGFGVEDASDSDSTDEEVDHEPRTPRATDAQTKPSLNYQKLNSMLYDYEDPPLPQYECHWDKLPPFETLPPPLSYYTSKPYRAWIDEHVDRMVKADIDATWDKNGNLDLQPGTIIHTLWHQIEREEEEMKERRERRERKRKQKEQMEKEEQVGQSIDASGDVKSGDDIQGDEEDCWKCGHKFRQPVSKEGGTVDPCRS